MSGRLQEGQDSQREGLLEFLKWAPFSDLDRRFARFIQREDRGQSFWLCRAAALVSFQLRRGHVFLDLSAPPATEDGEGMPVNPWPSLADWIKDLRRSNAVALPGGWAPLILTASGKLYLQRYRLYEELLATKLKRSAAMSAGGISPEIEERLDQLFGEADQQKQAARNALARRFSLISGGPGTGKTTTVLKILMLLLEREPELSVHLAAPTGKAAARLQGSIRDGLEYLNCSEAVRQRVEAKQASTIHRLLGTRPESVFFRHDAQNPLPADVVVLDEASMVDLPLMAKLVDALAADCRLIVLGDKDQLASVEAGSVLSGMVEAATEQSAQSEVPPLQGAATLLTKNYRFGNDSGIFHLCRAIQTANASDVAAALTGDQWADISWRSSPANSDLKEALRAKVLHGFGRGVQEKDPVRALDALARFQILTPVRSGPYGKENLNRLVEEILREEGLITPGSPNFSGRVLMVTQNDYALRLFNGDVGVLLEDEAAGLSAYFRSEDNSIRKVAPSRLPFTEPAFAMTVHKAQGSEFDEVLVILPALDTGILTRELLYTAVSRARKKVEVWGGEEIITRAVCRGVRRASGLAETLASVTAL